MLFAAGRLETLLESQGDLGTLGGWLGAMRRHRDTPAVADHNMWSYFAHRFGVDIVEHLEPKPGIAPTTRHLADVIQRMKADNIRVVLSSVYFNPRHADFVARNTAAAVVDMAHQVDSRPGADGYIEMIDHNIEALTAALEGSG